MNCLPKQVCHQLWQTVFMNTQGVRVQTGKQITLVFFPAVFYLKKLPVFGSAPCPLASTIAQQDANTTMGM